MAVRSKPARLVRQTLETLVSLPLLVGLHSVGLLGHFPLWVMLALMAVAGVMQQPGVERWLSGGDPSRRLTRRMALHLGVCAAIVYTNGWGPVLGVGFVLVTSMYLAYRGALWRRAAVLSTVYVAAGQAAIALGWTYTYLPGASAHAVALLGGLAAVFTIRMMGLAAERRERAEGALRHSEERFRALVHDSADVVIVVDDGGLLSYVSPAVHRMAGVHPEDVVGDRYADWIHPGDLPNLHRVIAAARADTGGDHGLELRARNPRSGWRWFEVTVRDLRDNPAVGGLVINHRDITERRAIQERQAYDATHDALTGLANRAAFLRALESAVTGAGPDGRRPAVLFVDLDGFKQVNDALGHEAGDALIVEVAGMLRRSVLGSDLVGRLGGDEFAILLAGVDSPDNAVTVAKRVLAEMDQAVPLCDREVFARASIGVAVLDPADPQAAARGGADLLHRADVAMYAAKRRKKHSYQLYVEGLNDPAAPTVGLEDELREAVRRDELRLQYQPIVTLDGGDLLGVEALVRWAHPTRGLLGPHLFIPLAEETGIIGDLGIWVLEQACRQVGRWQAAMPAGHRLELSVNLSPRQLTEPTLVDDVAAILRRTGFDPTNLVLEVTESALVDDTAAIPQLTALNALGVRIALDDFGTGYSSLRYLTRLPVNILKIDRCFVAELNGTPVASAVAEAVVRLAHILHLDTVAEGIEDAAQATELTLLGCRTGQGYHFARPLDPETLTELIERHAAWPWAQRELEAGGSDHPEVDGDVTVRAA